MLLFSRVLRDSTPRFVGPSVRPSVRPSVGPSVRHTLLFLGFCGLWPHCSCPSDQVTSNMAPAHPYATGLAVYPALLIRLFKNEVSFNLFFQLKTLISGLYKLLLKEEEERLPSLNGGWDSLSRWLNLTWPYKTNDLNEFIDPNDSDDLRNDSVHLRYDFLN